MERLRYVARARGEDPAGLVMETAEAISSLGPEPAELLMVCRRLVGRHPTCGPMWWFAASLIAQSGPLDHAWALAGEIEDDSTCDALAAALPEGVTVVVLGHPDIVASALARRGDIVVLAVDTDGRSDALVRRCERADVDAQLIPAHAALVAVRDADLVLIEADACSVTGVVSAMGSGLLAALAANEGTPAWLVAGRGRRLPERYVGVIERGAAAVPVWRADVEAVDVAHVTHVVGPAGITTLSTSTSGSALAPECPFVPELIPPPI